MVALTKMFGSEMIPSVTVKASEFGPTHPLQGHIGPATEVIQVRPVGPHPESWGAAVQLPTWFPHVTHTQTECKTYSLQCLRPGAENGGVENIGGTL